MLRESPLLLSVNRVGLSKSPTRPQIPPDHVDPGRQDGGDVKGQRIRPSASASRGPAQPMKSYRQNMIIMVALFVEGTKSMKQPSRAHLSENIFSGGNIPCFYAENSLFSQEQGIRLKTLKFQDKNMKNRICKAK
jgi:hypothetical protein